MNNNKFKKFSSPLLPAGASFGLMFSIFLIMAISYLVEGKDTAENGLFLSVILIAIPFIMWPFTSDNDFAQNYLPKILQPDTGFEEAYEVKSFLKKIVAGYVVALVFPFLSLKNLLNDNETKLEKFKNYFTDSVAPIISFVIIVFAIAMIIYFNANVINATNDVGIYYMAPAQRTLYQIISSLLIFSTFFALVPYHMAKAVNESWNYYLMFFFSTINIVILAGQINSNEIVYRKDIIIIIFGLSVIIMMYALFKLIFNSRDNKDYRILTLGDLKDEDRIEINGDMFNTFNAINSIMKDEKGKYFPGEDKYFDSSQLDENLKNYLTPSGVLEDLKGTRKEGFRNFLKRLDQDFINIYQAKRSWEKNVKSFLKTQDNNVLDGFFESQDFNKLKNADIKIIREAADELRKSWMQTRGIKQLPDSDKTQKLFGTALGAMGVNIALNAAASAILTNITIDVDDKISILFNRYMFVYLSKEFGKVEKAFKNFYIYNVNGTVQEIDNSGSSEENDEKALDIVKDFVLDVNNLVKDVVNIEYSILNPTINKRVNDDRLNNAINDKIDIFNQYHEIFKGGRGLNFSNYNIVVTTNLIDRYYRHIFLINSIITYYNMNMGVAIVNARKIYEIYYKSLLILREGAKKLFKNIYNFYADGAVASAIATHGGDETLANGVIANGAGGYDTSSGTALPSYKLVKIIAPGNNVNDINDIDIINFVNRDNNLIILPQISFNKEFYDPTAERLGLFNAPLNFFNTYPLIIQSYNRLIYYNCSLIMLDANNIKNYLESMQTIYTDENDNIRKKIDKNIIILDNTLNQVAGPPLVISGILLRLFNYDYLKTSRDTIMSEIIGNNKRANISIQKSFIKSAGNLLRSTFTDKQPIDKDIKFFEINKFYLDEDLTTELDDNAKIPYLYKDNADYSTKVNEALYRRLIQNLGNKKLIPSADYKKLSTNQKNTIANTELFINLYQYYFSQKSIDGANSVDNLFGKLASIYNSYPDSIRAYGKFLNTSENKTNANIKQNLINMDEGFPMLGSFTELIREGTISREIDIAKIISSENEEAYNEKLIVEGKQRIETETITAEAIKAEGETRAATEEVSKERSDILSRRIIIIINALRYLSSANSFKPTGGKYLIGGKIEIIYNYETGTVNGIANVNLLDNQYAYYLMTKIYLLTVKYLKGTDNFTIFTANRDNLRRTVSYFISNLIIAIYLRSFANTYFANINNTIKNRIKVKNNIVNANIRPAAITLMTTARAAGSGTEIRAKIDIYIQNNGILDGLGLASKPLMNNAITTENAGNEFRRLIIALASQATVNDANVISQIVSAKELTLAIVAGINAEAAALVTATVAINALGTLPTMTVIQKNILGGLITRTYAVVAYQLVLTNAVALITAANAAIDALVAVVPTPLPAGLSADYEEIIYYTRLFRYSRLAITFYPIVVDNYDMIRRIRACASFYPLLFKLINTDDDFKINQISINDEIFRNYNDYSVKTSTNNIDNFFTELNSNNGIDIVNNDITINDNLYEFMNNVKNDIQTTLINWLSSFEVGDFSAVGSAAAAKKNQLDSLIASGESNNNIAYLMMLRAVKSREINEAVITNFIELTPNLLTNFYNNKNKTLTEKENNFLNNQINNKFNSNITANADNSYPLLMKEAIIQNPIVNAFNIMN
jgi:hypothetical protein